MDLFQLINIGSYQALFFALLVGLKKDKAQPDWLLILFFVLTFGIAQLSWITLSENLEYVDYFFIGLPLLMLHLPILYFYIESHRRRLNWKDSYHLIPFLVSISIVLSNWTVLPTEEKVLVFQGFVENKIPIWLEFNRYSMEFIIFPLYTWLSWKSLKKHENYTLRRFSYTENISLSWLNRFIWLFLILSFFIILSHLATMISDYFVPMNTYPVPVFISILGVIYLGVYGIQNNIAFNEVERVDVNEQEMESVQNKEQGGAPKKQLETELFQQYEAQLIACMRENKPYLNPKLSLKDLAARVDIPYYHLSNLLNNHLETSFYDFVNQYRVAEFIRLQQDPKNQHLTLLSLAYDAGFNSKSTFYSIFKKYKGVSPSDYFKNKAAGQLVS